MKRPGQTITELKFTDAGQNRGAITWLLLFITIVLLATVLIAIGSGAIQIFGDAGPRLICTIGDEVVFSADVDAATQVGETITITRLGNTGPITPPEGGECFIAR